VNHSKELKHKAWGLCADRESYGRNLAVITERSGPVGFGEIWTILLLLRSPAIGSGVLCSFHACKVL